MLGRVGPQWNIDVAEYSFRCNRKPKPANCPRPGWPVSDVARPD